MLKDTGTVLEVCPSSNVCLGVAPSIETHQLRGLHDAGVAVTLNSDDPPFFFTDIGQEYALAARHHGFDPKGLLDMTRRAITAGFCDDETKAAALAKVDAWAQEHLA
jgi:adenosine deaminase